MESKEHVEDSAVVVFRDRDNGPGCRSKQEDVTASEEVVQNNIPLAPTTHRPDQCKKMLGVPARKLGPRALGSSVPDLGRLISVSAGDYRTGVVTPKQTL